MIIRGELSGDTWVKIIGRELGPSEVSPNRCSWWKYAFSQLKHIFNLRLWNAANTRYFLLKFGHMHLCGIDYKYFSPHCCKCNNFGCICAIKCGSACHGPHSNSVYSGSEHDQFDSPRLVKREVGFPKPWQALIGSNQPWCVNDSPYYRELFGDNWTRIVRRELCENCRCEIWNTKSLLLLVQTSSTWRLHAIKTWRTTKLGHSEAPSICVWGKNGGCEASLRRSATSALPKKVVSTVECLWKSGLLWVNFQSDWAVIVYQ